MDPKLVQVFRLLHAAVACIGVGLAGFLVGLKLESHPVIGTSVAVAFIGFALVTVAVVRAHRAWGRWGWKQEA